MVGNWGQDSSGSGHIPVAGSCEQGNDISGSIEVGEFLLTSSVTITCSRPTLIHGISCCEIPCTKGRIHFRSFGQSLQAVRGIIL